MDFINANDVNTRDVEIRHDKVESFISKFNTALQSKKCDGDGAFRLNTVLDKIPFLFKAEFELAKKNANTNGWELTEMEDNYNTVTYCLKRIKND